MILLPVRNVEKINQNPYGQSTFCIMVIPT